MHSHSIMAALAPSLALLSTASAARLHITAYTGNLTTVELGDGIAAQQYGNPTVQALEALSVSGACGEYSSWLTQVGDILYCVDESWPTPNGTLVSLKIGSDGAVTSLDSQPTFGGPVSSVVFGNGKALALAAYSGGGVNTFDISNPEALEPLQALKFQLPAGGINRTGINKDRQEAPHPHHTILDPTGNFLLVPDLGSDFVRVFSINNSTLQITETAPLVLAAGSGPRHAAFVVGTTKTYLYVITELTNNIFGYEVTYSQGNTLGFKQVYASNTHGEDVSKKLPSTVSAAEISLSPDTNFIVVSSRLEASLTIDNLDPTNSTKIASDPLIIFTIDKATGALAHRQTYAVGGVNPRHFSFNADGTLLAAVVSNDGRANVISRDPTNGLLGAIVATIKLVGMPGSVIFDEVSEA